VPAIAVKGAEWPPHLLRDDGKVSDVSDVLDVRASAELDAVVVANARLGVGEQVVDGHTDDEHAHGVGVCLAEHGAEPLDFLRSRKWHCLVVDWGLGRNDLACNALRVRHFLRSERLQKEEEVEVGDDGEDESEV
jgi:hypothetical protein